MDDFASPETREIGMKVMEKEINEIREKNPNGFKIFYEFLERIRNGERDLFL